jgi:hypothetical protein
MIVICTFLFWCLNVLHFYEGGCSGRKPHRRVEANAKSPRQRSGVCQKGRAPCDWVRRREKRPHRPGGASHCRREGASPVLVGDASPRRRRKRQLGAGRRGIPGQAARKPGFRCRRNYNSTVANCVLIECWRGTSSVTFVVPCCKVYDGRRSSSRGPTGRLWQ